LTSSIADKLNSAQQTAQQMGYSDAARWSCQTAQARWHLVPHPARAEGVRAPRSAPPVRLSTDIAVLDDPKGTRAAEVVRQLDRDLTNYWKGLGDGSAAEALIRFEAAQKRARQLALPYRTAQELADGPLDEILRRVQVLIDRNALDVELDVAAIAGGEPRPALLLSQLVDAFAQIKEFALTGMSASQLHRWRLPKDRAVANLSKVLGGDREANSIVLPEAIKFQAWLRDQIRAGTLQVQSANKQIGHLDNMLRTVERTHQLGIRPVFAAMRIEGAVGGTRSPFTTEWIGEVILKPGALDGLNPEARAIVYLVLNHGFRPAEVANLLPHRVVLNAPVPHVQIRPDLRKLKTPWSERDMPLLGVSLWIMRQFPEGFPRYRDKEDSLSAAVNKFFDQHRLLPTEKHTLYSFRHSFEDRMTAAEVPEKVAVALMGHKYDRPKYGDGPSLEQKLRWLRRISFMPPGHYGPPG
jgi:hypothetical protein